MNVVLDYMRYLLGLRDEPTANRTSVKRDRVDDDFSSDDESPALKRLKQLKRTSFPNIMERNDFWSNEEKQNKNVRIVPIQVEAGHPSTSTPYQPRRDRLVPVKLVSVSDKGPSSPVQKPRMHTPVRPVVHAVIDDEDEVTVIEGSKRAPRLYIDLDDEENSNNKNDEDVIFVKKVTTPPPVRPYKYFAANSGRDTAAEDVEQYCRRKLNEKNSNNGSPRTYSKFKAPAGITKSYKKAPTPVPRWMQPTKISNLPNSRNRFLNLNGNARSTLSEVFNLDEKRSYQELIRQALSHNSSSTRPFSFSRPGEIINIADEAASFRITQRAQKKALDDLKFVEKGLNAEKENESATEYDPLTVASINSSDSEVEIIQSESSTSSVRIDPINSLKDSFKDRAVTCSDWLSKLDSKYKKKKNDTQAKLAEARRESDIISKVNTEQKRAQLEHKLKYELSISESLFEEPQPTVELPALTPEQEKLVNRALGPGPPGQLLVEKFNLRIHRRDLQTLSGLNWLNDEVINFYMNLLMQRSEERKDLPKVYATNTFFYPKLMQSGQAGLRRWTRKVDIFAHDLLVVPVHLGVHWCVSVVDFRARRLAYLDSMGGRNQPCLDALLRYLRDEHLDKKGLPFDDEGWKAECLKDIPQQMNGSDCGMFACTFAEFSSRNAPYTFSQSHMPYLRRKAALEILTGKLLL